VYDKKFISVTTCSLSPPSVTNCHTSDPLPLERDVLYGRPLGIRSSLHLPTL